MNPSTSDWMRVVGRRAGDERWRLDRVTFVMTARQRSSAAIVRLSGCSRRGETFCRTLAPDRGMASAVLERHNRYRRAFQAIRRARHDNNDSLLEAITRRGG